MNRRRRSTRPPREIIPRLQSLDSSSPPEEREMLKWFLKETDRYPSWRHEVRKIVDADVRSENRSGGDLDLDDLLTMVNPRYSLSALEDMDEPQDIKPLPTLQDLRQSFENNHYFLDSENLFTVHQAIISGRPLLVTGPPGIGKTELAKQIAIAMKLDASDPTHFGTTFCTPDISIGESLYRWNDAKRLLDLQLVTYAIRGSNSDNVNALYHEIATAAYSERYLDLMPLLQACVIPWRTIRLIDEVDKSFPSFDNILLDVVGRFAFFVPEYGMVGTPVEGVGGDPHKPLFVIVSNGERDLSPMLVSRCVALFLDWLPETIEAKVIETKVGLDRMASGLVASFFRKMRELKMRQPPSTREAIATAVGIVSNKLECNNHNLFRLNSYWVKSIVDLAMINSNFRQGNEWKM